MVLLLDLDDEVPDPHADPNAPAGFVLRQQHRPLNHRDQKIPAVVSTTEGCNENNNVIITEGNPPFNPNQSNGLAAAVACYPIILLLASSIDLNTLHALSLTCRQIRYNLLQYRTRLLQSTLRCENEAQAQHLGLAALKPEGPKWHILGEAGHLVSGKVGTCARDLVGGCRRCGRVVCRNCTLKPPSPSHLPSRHRRLCPTCLSAPLSSLLAPSDSPCCCTTMVHLCAPCGASLATADTTYRRVWTWRTRYSTYLGGLGTGIGEGNEGVKCARGARCEGAVDVEVEFECSSTPSNLASSSSSSSSSSSLASSNGGGSESGAETSTPGKNEEEAGYWRQEIEGLGGIVKKKYRKKERVGGTVREWEDEREGGEVLGREKSGLERSWCGWCGRVVLGEKDLEAERGRLCV